MSGHYIAIEGIDGSGKSTAAKGFAERLGAVLTAEPGGTDFAQQCRSIVKDPDTDIGPEAEVMLFAAARADSLRKVVVPALEGGKNVVSDRSVFSSLAYQARNGIEITDIWNANRLATQRTLPSVVFQVEVDPDTAAERIAEARGGGDRMELVTNAEDLIRNFNLIRQGLHTALGAYSTTWFKIDGLGTPEEVVDEMLLYFERWESDQLDRNPYAPQYYMGSSRMERFRNIEQPKFESAPAIAIGEAATYAQTRGKKQMKTHIWRMRDLVDGNPWFAACGQTAHGIANRETDLRNVTCKRCAEIAVLVEHLSFDPVQVVDTSVGSR